MQPRRRLAERAVEFEREHRASAAFQEAALPKRAVNDAAAAARAREGIVRVLRAYGASESNLSTTELVDSELLGNAVRHGSDEVEFALDVSDGSAILHALDRGPGFTRDAGSSS